jgi:hypothetical protein
VDSSVMIENSIPSRNPRSLRQYLSKRVTLTFWLSAQATNFQGPAPTGLRSCSLPSSWIALGEAIMPARSERIAGRAASGLDIRIVTCNGPVTSTEVMLDRSALMLER